MSGYDSDSLPKLFRYPLDRSHHWQSFVPLQSKVFSIIYMLHTLVWEENAPVSVFILLGHECTVQLSGWGLFIFLALLSRYLNIYLVLEVPVKISPVRDDHIRALQHYICVPLSVTNYLFSVTVKWSLCAMLQSWASVIFSVETRAWTENNTWWTLTMALLFLQIRDL